MTATSLMFVKLYITFKVKLSFFAALYYNRKNLRSIMATRETSSSLVSRPPDFWIWVLGSVLDSGKCSAFWEVFWDSGKCLWLLGSVYGFWEVFWILESVYGFWEVFWILGSALSLWGTVQRNTKRCGTCDTAKRRFFLFQVVIGCISSNHGAC